MVKEYRREANTMVIEVDGEARKEYCDELVQLTGRTTLNCYAEGSQVLVFLRSSARMRIRVDETSVEELYEEIASILDGRFRSIRDKVLYIRFMALRPRTLENVLGNALRIAEAWRKGKRRKMPPGVFTFFEKSASKIARLERILASMKNSKHPLMRRYYEWGRRIIDMAYDLARIIEEYDNRRIKEKEKEG